MSSSIELLPRSVNNHNLTNKMNHSMDSSESKRKSSVTDMNGSTNPATTLLIHDQDAAVKPKLMSRLEFKHFLKRNNGLYSTTNQYDLNSETMGDQANPIRKTARINDLHNSILISKYIQYILIGLLLLVGGGLLYALVRIHELADSTFWLRTSLTTETVRAQVAENGFLFYDETKSLFHDVSLYRNRDQLPVCYIEDNYNISHSDCYLYTAKGPVIRRFYLTIANKMSYSKLAVVVNGTTPGPEIRVNQYDILEVIVSNELTVGTAIHFHGMTQHGTTFADGVPGLTQCPILPNSVNSFTYRFVVSESGTYWYHGHIYSHKPDGLVGSFIINRVERNQYNSIYKVKELIEYSSEYSLLFGDYLAIAGDTYPSPPYPANRYTGGVNTLLRPGSNATQIIVNGELDPTDFLCTCSCCSDLLNCDQNTIINYTYSVPSCSSDYCNVTACTSLYPNYCTPISFTLQKSISSCVEKLNYTIAAIPLRHEMKDSKTERIRLINAGNKAFLQFWFDDAMDVTIIELDGEDISPTAASSVLMHVAQRSSILIDIDQIRIHYPSVYSRGYLIWYLSDTHRAYASQDPLIPMPPANFNYKGFNQYPCPLWDSITSPAGNPNTDPPGIPTTNSGQTCYPIRWGYITFNNQGITNSSNINLPPRKPFFFTGEYSRKLINYPSGPIDGLSPFASNHISLFPAVYSPAPTWSQVTHVVTMKLFVNPTTSINGNPFPTGLFRQNPPYMFPYYLMNSSLIFNAHPNSIYNSTYDPFIDPDDYKVYVSADRNNAFRIPFNAVVEVRVQTERGISHSYHIHGHKFWVIDETNKRKAVYNNHIRRDTVNVGPGTLKLRFIANNPGVQAVHCHFDFHMAGGMMALFLEAPDKLAATGIEIPEDNVNTCLLQAAPLAN